MVPIILISTHARPTSFFSRDILSKEDKTLFWI